MRHDEILGFLHRLLPPGVEPTFVWAAHWELAFWILTLLLAAILLFLKPLWLARAEGGFRRISQHRGWCVCGVFAAAIVIRLSLLPLIPVPVPVLHDEFSYLVGADTFVSGRVANPPHPMWIHLETFHVNMQPAYQSMYPPGQAMAIAVGQKLTGVPWAGVLFSVALMCAVFCWMLQGWMPPEWALLAVLFAVVRYSTFSYWVNSYFGGAVAAIGGALLLGALPSMRRSLTSAADRDLRGQALFFVGEQPPAGRLPFQHSISICASLSAHSLAASLQTVADAHSDAGRALAGGHCRLDALLQLARHRSCADHAVHVEPGYVSREPAILLSEDVPSGTLQPPGDARFLHVSRAS